MKKASSKKCDKYQDGGVVPDWSSDTPVSPDDFKRINEFLKKNRMEGSSPEERFVKAKKNIDSVQSSSGGSLSTKDQEIFKKAFPESASESVDDADWDYSKDQETEDRRRVAEDDKSFNPEARDFKYKDGGVVKKKKEPFSRLMGMLKK